MVYDDEKIPDVNEIHKIMKECASHIAKKEARNYSAYFKQMVDMFNVMAFNALKGTAACFKNVVKCEQVVKHWNDAIVNYHIVEEYQQLIGVHFLTGRLTSLFLNYIDSMRSIKPTNPVKTLDEWILFNHKDKASYNQQQKQTVFLVTSFLFELLILLLRSAIESIPCGIPMTFFLNIVCLTICGLFVFNCSRYLRISYLYTI